MKAGNVLFLMKAVPLLQCPAPLFENHGIKHNEYVIPLDSGHQRASWDKIRQELQSWCKNDNHVLCGRQPRQKSTNPI